MSVFTKISGTICISVPDSKYCRNCPPPHPCDSGTCFQQLTPNEMDTDPFMIAPDIITHLSIHMTKTYKL